MIIGSGVEDVAFGKGRGSNLPAVGKEEQPPNIFPQDTVEIRGNNAENAETLRKGGFYLSGLIPSNTPMESLLKVAGTTNLQTAMAVLFLMEQAEQLGERLKSCGVNPVKQPVTKMVL